MATRGVIFDLFHTLTARESEWSERPATCDLLGVDRRAWDRAMRESTHWRDTGQEREPLAILRRLVNQVDATIPEERIREVLGQRTQRFLDCFQRIPRENLAMLARLRASGLRLGLVSNADAMDVAAFRTSALVGLFDAELFSCEVGCAKPEARIYRMCLETLGLPAEDCIFIGDGGSDELAGAKAVGLRTVFVSGVIEELWPERIEPRRRIADHHVRWAWEAEPLLRPLETA